MKHNGEIAIFIIGFIIGAFIMYISCNVYWWNKYEGVLNRHNLQTEVRDIDGVPRKIPTPHWRPE